MGQTYQTVYYKPQILKVSVGKPKKHICNRLAIAEQADQNNRNGRMIVLLFCIVFY